MEGFRILHRGNVFEVSTWALDTGVATIQPHNDELLKLLRDVAIMDTPLLYRPKVGWYEVILPNQSLQPTTATVLL